jgi:hypothetical protein
MQEVSNGLTIPILHDAFRAVTPYLVLLYSENGATHGLRTEKDTLLSQRVSWKIDETSNTHHCSHSVRVDDRSGGMCV